MTEANGPKFQALSPLTVRLRHDQIIMLTDIERKDHEPACQRATSRANYKEYYHPGARRSAIGLAGRHSRDR